MNPEKSICIMVAPVEIFLILKMSSQKSILKKEIFFWMQDVGDGYFSIAASKIVGDEGKVYAVDTYEESIDILKKGIQREGIVNIETIVVDITKKIPLKDEIIDICLMVNVLHGFVANDEVEEAMGEIARVIREGGTFAVVDFKKIEDSVDSPIPTKLKLVRVMRNLKLRLIGPPMSIRLSPDEVGKIIAQYGFEVAKNVEAGPYHYAVISIKK